MPTPERAYALLTVKALDPATRTFSGIASTPELDRQGHIIDLAGATFRNPIPLLFFHDQRAPIGSATLRKRGDGIAFEASIPVVDTPGRVKDRIDEAWDSIKAGLITGVSIGFHPVGDAFQVVKGGLKFLKTEIFELSLVTIPANASASILTVKSLAASGSTLPCVAGSPLERPPMKTTTAEHIATLKATHATKTARMGEIMSKSAEDAITLGESADAKEYDTLTLDVKSLETDIARLHALEAAQLAIAVPVAGVPAARPALVQVGKKTLEPGTAFIRGVMAIAASKGNRMEAIEIAKQWKDSTPEVELWMKAAVTPGTTTDPTWAGALVQIQNLTGEFLELLRPATIIGKIPALRRVPFNIQVPIQTAGGTYGWVGQGAPKPVTRMTFGTDSLGIAKAAGIIVLTQELVKLSNPSAEAIVRAEMVAGITQFLDQQFIDPAVVAVASVSPGSVTNGTVALTAGASALVDIHNLIAWFAAANIPLAGLVFIMSETNAFTLGMQRDASGNRVFPNMGAAGGTAEGVTVIASQAAGTNVIALAPNYILFADDGGVTIDVSTEASVQMDSAPMNPADATTVYRSFWQDNLVGIRAERFINWKRVKLEAVKYVSGAAYVPTAAAASVPPGQA